MSPLLDVWKWFYGLEPRTKWMIGGGAALAVAGYYIYRHMQANALASAQAAMTAARQSASEPVLALDANWTAAVAPIPQDAELLLPQAQCNAQGGTWVGGMCILPTAPAASLSGLSACVSSVKRKGFGQ